jgi:glycosyltransferase involved in cell wall biosynthesis
MDVFDYYHRRIDRRSRLHLVGDPSGDPPCFRGVVARWERLASREAIEVVGTVSDGALEAYYQAADLLLCPSEHEGLCLPPLLAMAHGVPVLARRAAALPETLGTGAVLFEGDDPARIAELAHVMLEDAAVRSRLIEAGRRHLGRYAPAEVSRSWSVALAAMRAGTS